MRENERILTSVATFYEGEIVHLRPDMGGGTYRVVHVLPNDANGMNRALAERVREPAD